MPRASDLEHLKACSLVPLSSSPLHPKLQLTASYTTTMKLLFIAFLFTILAALGAAVAPLKSVVVSYPEDTPDHIVSQAKDAIWAAVRVQGILIPKQRLLT
jgi:hypothetical protein